MIGLIHRVAGNAGERRLVAKCGMEGTLVWFGLDRWCRDGSGINVWRCPRRRVGLRAKRRIRGHLQRGPRPPRIRIHTLREEITPSVNRY